MSAIKILRLVHDKIPCIPQLQVENLSGVHRSSTVRERQKFLENEEDAAHPNSNEEDAQIVEELLGENQSTNMQIKSQQQLLKICREE